jgi:hypothetical protein
MLYSPTQEPPTKPCPKCQTPLKLKNTTRKTTTELIAEEKKARGGSRRYKHLYSYTVPHPTCADVMSHSKHTHMNIYI